MATRSVKLHVANARRQTPPGGGVGERHTFLMNVSDVPELPLDPNPRGQRIDRGIYRQVKDSLLGNDGYFIWKNHGITILAKSVRKIDDVTYEVEMEPDHHGIVDGGHTYQIIREVVAENGQSTDAQSVEVRVFTGIVPDELDAVDVAGALNTTMQVQEMSLANLAGKF
ncbi:MAG: AIPR family protein, partial [Acidimicrobiia bacterium]